MGKIYQGSLALLSDLYELTMAYGYWKQKLADKESVFHLFFRKQPFQGTFAIAAGLETVTDYLENFKFDGADLAYLESLKTGSGAQLFENAFLDYLKDLKFSCDIDAMPEGTPAFPYEPLLRVQGPIIQAQLLESMLLNIINFQSLIATKSARVCWAARPDPVVEFGLRRAQGIDGALSASRASFIGGCDSTSNVLAGKLFGIPVKGTHAHSWIMLFDDEEESFRSFASALPDNCIFLIDTYDSIKGAKKAVKVALEMREKGIEMAGVRLDSGDLAYLSIAVRKILDEAGFPHAKIMASNEMDEFIITALKQQNAQIDIWGVGTNLVTGKDQPALDGVYKLSAIRDPGKKWNYKVKISEQLIKVTNPGILQVRRYRDENGYAADMMYDIASPLPKTCTMIDPFDATHTKNIDSDMAYEDLLVPIFRKGKKVYETPSLEEMKQRTCQELDKFHPSIRRFLYPQPYFTGFEQNLYQTKLALIKEIKERK
jgi:nicotinate phosphoribosyltransferase